MRVEIKIDPDGGEAYAVLRLTTLTPAIQAAISLLEQEGQTSALTAQRDKITYLLEPKDIELVRTEGRETALYDRQKQRYVLAKPLYEAEKILGEPFLRISKSALINLRCIDHVSASFNGTMEIVMKNGAGEIITRGYKASFKERLGV